MAGTSAKAAVQVNIVGRDGTVGPPLFISPQSDSRQAQLTDFLFPVTAHGNHRSGVNSSGNSSLLMVHHETNVRLARMYLCSVTEVICQTIIFPGVIFSVIRILLRGFLYRLVTGLFLLIYL